MANTALVIEFVPQMAYLALMVFARIGSIIMTMPAIGENLFPTTVRLSLAIAVTLVMVPLAAHLYPEMPGTAFGLTVAIVSEVIIGIFIGGTARLAMGALAVGGTIISMQTGLGMARTIDPTQGTQGAVVSSFFSILAITLIFVTDMHHLMFLAMRDSYTLFAPMTSYPTADFAQMAVEAMSGAFRIAFQLAAPFIVFGLIFFVGIGLLARLMPQVPIFFIAMPLNIILGFLLLMFLLSTLMMWFLGYFEETLSHFLA